jgi:Na+/H+-dicarboxylate symporter
MSITTRVLLGLAAGFAVGIALSAAEPSLLESVTAWVQPIGTLWLNALQMTVVLLVVALLITGVAAASDAAASGRIALLALLLFVGLLASGGVFGAYVGYVGMALLPDDPARAEALRDGVSSTVAPAEAPSVAEWVTGIVPANPIGAAAEGAMLPLVVFALFFGFAITRIDPARRESLTGFFEAIIDTMMVIVHWVLWAAPVGIFALVLPITARLGIGVLGAIASYIVLVCGLCVLVTLLFYPIAAVFGGIPVRRFAREVAPAQAVAFSTQSSLASLPAMLEGSRHLGIPSRETSIVLPLAVSVFRVGGPVAYLAAAVFVAWMYGIDLSPFQIAAGSAVGVLVSIGAVGLPGHINFMGTYFPVFTAMGLPLDPLGLLLAVNAIPDIGITVANVTADVAVTGVVARHTGTEEIVPVPAASSSVAEG